MIEKTPAAGRLSWWLPLCASIVGIVVFIAIAISQADTFLLLSVFVVAPTLFVGSIALPIYAAARNRRQLLSIVAMLVILWTIAVSLFLYDHENPFALRETARWFAWSHRYKQEVLAQPTSVDGALKHIEWDGSGFAGVANNTVYLVFDPADALSAAAKSHQAGKFNGIPCAVRVIRRLQSHWYAVLFYTDQAWGQCN